MALCEATKEAMYLRQLMADIKNSEQPKVTILEDNMACRLISKDAQHHTRAKHIDVQYHFSRECQEAGHTEVIQVHTQRQLADYLTKYLSANTLRRLVKCAFGHDPEFHGEDPKTPLVEANTSSTTSPNEQCMGEDRRE